MTKWGRLRVDEQGEFAELCEADGGDYIGLALELGVGKERINTVVDYKGSLEKGVKFAGTMNAGGTEGLMHLATLAAPGDLDVAIGQASPPLAEVQDEYRAVSNRSSTRSHLRPVDVSCTSGYRREYR